MDRVAVDEQESPRADERPPRRRGMVGLWLAIVSLVLTAALLPLVVIPGVLGVLSLPVVLLAAAAGVIGLVLSIRARSARNLAGWALRFGIVGLAVNVAMIAVIAVGVLSRPQYTQVEVRAQGGPGLTATFADDFESYTEAWPQNGWKQFTTTKSSAEISITSPEDSTQRDVSCQILWNGEVVVEESSDTGSVTCRYDED